MPALAKLVSSAGLRLWVARGAVFLGVLVLGALINWILARLIHTAGLSGTDRLIGMLFGAARGALLIGASVWLLRAAGMEQEPWWRESKLIPYAAPAADAAWAAAKRGLEQLQAQKRALAAANSQIRV
jgi:membrane protein required for colicin V production